MSSTDEIFNPRAIEMISKVGGEKLVREMIALFETSGRERLARAQAAADSGDAQAFEKICHSLKSSAGQLGAAELQSLCAENERRIGASEPVDLVAEILRLEISFTRALAALKACHD